MKKSDLDKKVADILGIKDASAVTTEFLNQIALALANGEEVALRSFGKIRLVVEHRKGTVRMQDARTKVMRDFQVNERYRIYFSKSAAFRKLLKSLAGDSNGQVRSRRKS